MKHPIAFICAAGFIGAVLWAQRPDPPAFTSVTSPAVEEPLPIADPDGIRLFEEYQREAIALDRQMADDVVTRACGLQPFEWIEKRLNTFWEDREKRLAKLHAPDRPYAEEYDRKLIRERIEHRLNGSTVPTDEACARLIREAVL